jgi:hypothetical protein
MWRIFFVLMVLRLLVKSGVAVLPCPQGQSPSQRNNEISQREIPGRCETEPEPRQRAAEEPQSHRRGNRGNEPAQPSVGRQWRVPDAILPGHTCTEIHNNRRHRQRPLLGPVLPLHPMLPTTRRCVQPHELQHVLACKLH